MIDMIDIIDMIDMIDIIISYLNINLSKDFLLIILILYESIYSLIYCHTLFYINY